MKLKRRDHIESETQRLRQADEKCRTNETIIAGEKILEENGIIDGVNLVYYLQFVVGRLDEIERKLDKLVKR